MLPDLGSLALFVRAAEMRNLTRTAEASLITVPAASRRLSLLEHQFRAQLFERHSRGLELTPAGDRLLLLAREVIASVHHMRMQMSNDGRGQQSVLWVHGNTSAMAQFLPSDIAAFSPGHPDMRAVLLESWSDDAVRRVRTGEVGLAVIVGPEVGDLHTAPYRHNHLAVVMRSDDELAAQKPLAFADVLERYLVGPEGNSTLTRLLEARAAQLMRPMALRVQVRSFEAMCRAVEARLGIGVLPLAAALDLAVEPLRDDWARRSMQLVTRVAPVAGSSLGALVGHL